MAVSTQQDDRKKALNLAIAQIEKSCGKGSIMKMGAESARVRIDAISTGAINLDAAIGIGLLVDGQLGDRDFRQHLIGGDLVFLLGRRETIDESLAQVVVLLCPRELGGG